MKSYLTRKVLVLRSTGGTTVSKLNKTSCLSLCVLRIMIDDADILKRRSDIVGKSNNNNKNNNNKTFILRHKT